MHFKNGRAANFGDPVVCLGYDGKVTAGKIHSLQPGSACNVSVAVPTMGGVEHLTCRDVGTMYHAEDAFNRIEDVAKNPPAPDDSGARV